jgi:hypothetical protein
MNMPASPPSVVAFSTEVRLALEVDGVSFELADAGPDDAILRKPAKVRPGPASVIVTIDGRPTVRSVLVTGQGADGRFVYYDVAPAAVAGVSES